MAAPTPTFRLVSRTAHPGFLETPLESWTSERLVEVARGIHRHVVRFVEIGGSFYALKELPPRLAWREYRLFRRDAGALSAYLVDTETGELHTGSPRASAATISTSPRRT